MPTPRETPVQLSVSNKIVPGIVTDGVSGISFLSADASLNTLQFRLLHPIDISDGEAFSYEKKIRFTITGSPDGEAFSDFRVYVLTEPEDSCYVKVQNRYFVPQIPATVSGFLNLGDYNEQYEDAVYVLGDLYEYGDYTDYLISFILAGADSDTGEKEFDIFYSYSGYGQLNVQRYDGNFVDDIGGVQSEQDGCSFADGKWADELGAVVVSDGAWIKKRHIGTARRENGSFCIYRQSLLDYSAITGVQYIFYWQDVVGLYFNGADKKYYLEYYNGEEWLEISTDPQDFLADEWHHLIASWDFSSGLEIWIDAVLEASVSATWSAGSSVISDQDGFILETQDGGLVSTQEEFLGALDTYGYVWTGSAPLGTNSAESRFDDEVIYNKRLRSTDISRLFSGA